MSGSRKKLRAILLSFVMVLSVFGGTVAFAGTAAAASGTTIQPGSQAAGQTTQYTVVSTIDGATAGNGNNIQTIELNTGGSDDADNPDFSDVTASDILRIGEDTDSDGTIDNDFSGDVNGVSTGANNGILQVSLNDAQAVGNGNDLIFEFSDVVNPTNTGDKTITLTVSDFTSGSESDDGTLSISDPLQVSTSPSSVTRGETANVDVSITDQNDDTFTGQAQVAIIGLTNTNDDNAAGTAGSGTDGESNDVNGETNLDDTANDRDYTILKSGSTTSGTFTTSISLAGTGQNANSNDRAIGEYFVVVRRGSTSFSTLTPFSGPNPDNDNVVTNNFDGSTRLDATPNATVETVDVTRGDSPTISGSVTVSDGSGFSDYPVTIQNVNASSLVGSTSTADNGDFATTETLADAATHSAALELYNSSTNSLEDFDLDTFDVAPNSLSVSTSSSSFTASVSKSDSITLTAEAADTQENGNDVNVTRFDLSGLELSEVDVSSDGSQYIDKVTLTDGTEIGNLDTTEEFNPATADPDGDTTNEIDAAASAAGNIVTTTNVNIESIVLGTDTAAPNADNDLDVQLLAPSAGDLTVEGQVEDIAQGADTANTPNSPDFVGTQTITAEEPDDLNIEVSPSDIQIAGGDVDPSDDDQDVTITVQDAGGNGLIDGASADGEIQSLTFELAGNGTEFEVEDDGGDDGNIAASGDTKSLSNTGTNIDSTSVTVDESDVSGDRTQFDIESVLAEQNGSIDVTVTADVVGQSNDVSDSASITATDSVSVDGLPSGELTVGTVTDLNITVTDGEGTPLNNRQVVIGSAGPNNDNANNDNDVFALDTDGDGQNEKTGIDALSIDGSSGTVDLETDGSGGYDDDSSISVTVNNGEYKLEGLNITSAGEDIDVLVTDGGETAGDAKAFFPDQFSTVGEDVYNVSSDVDPFVAGFQEQVNITVSQDGQTINGTELNNLASSGNSEVSQDANTLTAIGGGDTTDLDGDGTDETIQVDVTPVSTSDVNITIANAANDEIGTSDISALEPEIETNIENNRLTQRLNQTLDVSVVDPRDGSRLADSGDTADVRVTVRNGTLELNDPDGDVDAQNDPNDASAPNFEFDDDDDGNRDGVVANNLADSNVTFNVLPYDADNEQFKLELEADSDTGNFFASTNLTIERPQVTATPTSIQIGSQETLEVIAEDANGNALAQRNIRIDGSVSPITGSTDDSGFIAVQVNPQATGTINIHTASDDDLNTNGGLSPVGLAASGSVEDTVNVTTEQSEFDVTVDPQTVTANTTTTVTVTATNNASGDAVEGASVDLSGAGVNESAQTDANGEAAIDVNASETGTIEVTVNDAGFNPATLTITVEEDAPAYYTLKLSNSIADRDVHAAIISIFPTHRQSGSTALLPHSVYRYTRTHTGGQR